MFSQHRIIYPVVLQAVAQIKSQAQAALDSLNTEYDSILTDADEFDGVTQALFRDAAESNREKAILTLNTMLKLTRFIENASTRIRNEDERRATGFNATSGSTTGIVGWR